MTTKELLSSKLARTKLGTPKQDTVINRMLATLAACGWVYPVYTQGSGRFARTVDMTKVIRKFLWENEISHQLENNGPRGGKIHNRINLD